jgi:hypothetical protein
MVQLVVRINCPMTVPVPEPWVILLLNLIVLVVLAIPIYGMGIGFAGVVVGIGVRWRLVRQPTTTRQDARRYGRHALIAGGTYLAVFATTGIVLKSDFDLRLLLIAEPALLLGIAAIVLARPSAGHAVRLWELMGLHAWIGLAIAIPVELFALQLARDMRRTIAETRERLTFADEIMVKGYDQAVRAKIWSVHSDQTRQWARMGLEDARAGLGATEELAVKTRRGPERRRLLELRDEFADQIGRYEEFVRGLGEKP